MKKITKPGLKTNVFEQKQKGFYGIRIKILLGNLSTGSARKLAHLIKNYAADDLRITINQGFILRFIEKDALPLFYSELKKLGFADSGFDSTIDITACPGTDTCNLGISDSTSISEELERVMKEEYPDLIFNNDIKIKISGCMNSCGQHGLANIGFHGSSIKNNGKVLPALQLMLGGGNLGNGEGRFAERVIKLPSKRVPDALRALLNDYDKNSFEGEYFNSYFDRQRKDYFQKLLKPLTNLSTIKDSDYIDWGGDEDFKIHVGTGECAGVIVDLVATLLYESEEKLGWATETFNNQAYADSVYHSYSVFVNAAKALLLLKDVSCTNQHSIITNFNDQFADETFFSFETDFKTLVFQINQNEPEKDFAEKYLNEAKDFLAKAKAYRESEVLNEVKTN